MPVNVLGELRELKDDVDRHARNYTYTLDHPHPLIDTIRYKAEARHYNWVARQIMHLIHRIEDEGIALDASP